MDQEDETDVMDELQEADQIVNFTRNSRVPGRSALQGPYQSESKKIVAMFKNVQCNRHPLHKSVQNMPIKKTVTFNEDVTTHYILLPETSPLNLEQHGPIRKLQGQPMRYCTYNLCRIQKSVCAQNRTHV